MPGWDQAKEVGIEQRNGKEGDVRPYVEHLSKMDCGDVVAFVTCRSELIW